MIVNRPVARIRRFANPCSIHRVIPIPRPAGTNGPDDPGGSGSVWLGPFPAEDDPRWGPWQEIRIARRLSGPSRRAMRPYGFDAGTTHRGTPGRPKLPRR